MTNSLIAQPLLITETTDDIKKTTSFLAFMLDCHNTFNRLARETEECLAQLLDDNEE